MYMRMYAHALRYRLSEMANFTSVSVSGGVQALSNAIAVAIIRSQQSPGTVTSPSTIATGGTANPGQASQGGHSNSSGAQGGQGS